MTLLKTVPVRLNVSNLYSAEEFEEGINIATQGSQVYVVVVDNGSVQVNPTTLYMEDL